MTHHIPGRRSASPSPERFAMSLSNLAGVRPGPFIPFRVAFPPWTARKQGRLNNPRVVSAQGQRERGAPTIF